MAEIPVVGDRFDRPSGDRPLGVTLVSLLQFLQALIVLGFGVLVAVGGGILFGPFGLILGGIIILLGVVLFYIGLGLWNMKRWAWNWAMIVNILAAILNALAQNWISVILAVIIIVYLNQEDVKSRFV